MIEITGHTNPARCALKYIELLVDNDLIDYESFDNMINKLEGNIPQEILDDGFMVKDSDDLIKLCNIGGFILFLENGMWKCAEQCK